MNLVLKRMIKEGYSVLPNGKKIKVHSSIQQQDGELLAKIIRKLKPKTCLEVGLGYGISTLFILEELSKMKDSKLIGIDGFQFETGFNKITQGHGWDGVGVHNVKSAGYGSIYKLYNSISQDILPQLKRKGLRIDFANVDGGGKFDELMVDFFYINEMLKVGELLFLIATSALLWKYAIL